MNQIINIFFTTCLNSFLFWLLLGLISIVLCASITLIIIGYANKIFQNTKIDIAEKNINRLSKQLDSSIELDTKSHKEICDLDEYQEDIVSKMKIYNDINNVSLFGIYFRNLKKQK